MYRSASTLNIFHSSTFHSIGHCQQVSRELDIHRDVHLVHSLAFSNKITIQEIISNQFHHIKFAYKQVSCYTMSLFINQLVNTHYKFIPFPILSEPVHQCIILTPQFNSREVRLGTIFHTYSIHPNTTQYCNVDCSMSSSVIDLSLNAIVPSKSCVLYTPAPVLSLFYAI